VYEVVALLAGVAVGAVLRHRSWRGFLLAAVPLCVGIGFAVSALSGELEVSVGFLIFDVSQSLVAAVLTAVLLRALERRAQRS
jgi:hypothetical protein